MENYKQLIDFISKFNDNIFRETENEITFFYKCKVKHMYDSPFSYLENFPFTNFIVEIDGQAYDQYSSLDEYKQSYSHDNGDEYKEIDDLIVLKGDIEKRLLTEQVTIENCFIFSSMEKFQLNINFLELTNERKCTFIGIIDCNEKVFDSGFIKIGSADSLINEVDKNVSDSDYYEFKKSNQIYFDKKFSNYLEYSNAWYSKYWAYHNDKLLSFIYMKQIKDFFFFICNKEVTSETFLIRGYKSVLLKIGDFSYNRSFCDKIYRLLNFYVSSDNQHDKLIIMRNTFTLFLDEESDSQKLNEKIDEIVKSIYYNFDLYIKEKVKLFLEQKNLAIKEFNSVAKDIQKNIDSIITQIRTVLLSLLGTVFLSLLNSVRDSKQLYVLNLVFISYSFYMIINSISIFFQYKQVSIMKENLKSQIKSLGIKVDSEDNEEKKSSKTIHNEISSDDELSYSNLNDKYLVKIIKQFTHYRLISSISIFIIGVFFLGMYLSNRFGFFPNLKEIVKYILGY
ncbi:hypothetical protein [Enterococcus avium]|uniref:hypothetical protein n=1 Tax=Enterococcus avium TaxID=33945 RepID=UPI0032E4440F